MQRNTYSAASIRRVLDEFEAGYGMPSHAFYRAHISDGDGLEAMPGRQRQAWAMFYRTYERMTESGFANQVSREMETV